MAQFVYAPISRPLAAALTCIARLVPPPPSRTPFVGHMSIQVSESAQVHVIASAARLLTENDCSAGVKGPPTGPLNVIPVSGVMANAPIPAADQACSTLRTQLVLRSSAAETQALRAAR